MMLMMIMMMIIIIIHKILRCHLKQQISAQLIGGVYQTENIMQIIRPSTYRHATYRNSVAGHDLKLV